MNKKKWILTTTLVVALTAVLAIGGTLAVLNKITETAKNVFTSSQDIDTRLEEEFDSETAENYKPGDVIHKEPTIMNEDGSVSIYVAVKLDYKERIDTADDGSSIYSMMSAAEFKKYAETVAERDEDGNIVKAISGDWTLIGTDANGSELYIYKTDVAPGTSTSAIFSEVQVNIALKQVITYTSRTQTVYKIDEDGNETVVSVDTETFDPTTEYYVKDADGERKVFDDFTLPEFAIDVTGYAVQSEGLTLTISEGGATGTAVGELTKLAGF